MAPTARAALLCGDPARALLLAQELLAEPRMSNHHRGLWGYWGTTPEGAELTIQATGIGGPSAAVVLGELIEAGLTHAVRIGTCTSADGSLPLGTGVVAATAAAPGTAPAAADRALSDALTAAGAGPALALLSLEHLHEPPGSEHTAGAPADGRAGAGDPFDLQTATLLQLASARGIAIAATLVVASSGGVPLEDEALDASALRLGAIAAPIVAAAALAKGSTSARG